ncbi:MAG: PilZ domain-containing protein [Rhizobiales bacterium]|nr:PilZ domain-containing protein [Hyphomicrobiales bacterium]MBI3674333.1 PilZ domain-containing protein [Hyphomicrobiales bacterium]
MASAQRHAVAEYRDRILNLAQSEEPRPEGLERLLKQILLLTQEERIALLSELESSVLIAALERRLAAAKLDDGAQTPLSGTKDESDKRRAMRRRVLLAGKIVFNGRLSVADCQIRDLSETGCRLVASSPEPIPRSFRLEYAVSGKPNARDCEVMWRKEGLMGVRFAS